jgi:hypothetical protein
VVALTIAVAALTGALGIAWHELVQLRRQVDQLTSRQSQWVDIPGEHVLGTPDTPGDGDTTRPAAQLADRQQPEPWQANVRVNGAAR